VEKRILRELDKIRVEEMPENPDLRTWNEIASEVAPKIGMEPEQCKARLNDLVYRGFVEAREIGYPPVSRPRITDKGIEALQPWWRRHMGPVLIGILITLVGGLLAWVARRWLQNFL